MEKHFYTYILECADGSYYTGWTDNLERRLDAHNSGKGAKYTRSRTPVKLAASFVFESKSEAMKHEIFIKTLSRPKKAELIKNAGLTT